MPSVLQVGILYLYSRFLAGGVLVVDLLSFAQAIQNFLCVFQSCDNCCLSLVSDSG